MKGRAFLSGLLWSLYTVSSAVKPSCKRDSCFYAVANQAIGGPKRTQRRDDCAGVLRTVIDDDIKTIYKTVYSTSTNSATITETTKTNTRTSITRVFSSTTTRIGAAPVLARADGSDGFEAGGKEGEFAVLEARDTVIVKGTVPKYAKNCKDIQAYGMACLCLGVIAQVVKAFTVTSTIAQTTATTTTSMVGAEATAVVCGPTYRCGQGAASTCRGSSCFCGKTDMGNQCIERAPSIQTCASGEECPQGSFCVFDLCNTSAGLCIEQGVCQNPLVVRGLFMRMDESLRLPWYMGGTPM